MPSAATVCALLALLLLPATALAQDQNPSANDPEKDSPAGSVYELPLESAREDGAPRRRPGSPSDGGEKESSSAGGDPDSPIRSENGFGSSARVPGVDPPRAGKDANPAGEASRQVATPIAAAEDDGGSGPSLSLILLLVALLVVVGGVTGTLAGRARRR